VLKIKKQRAKDKKDKEKFDPGFLILLIPQIYRAGKADQERAESQEKTEKTRCL
jgi:hypothetical protein